MDSQYMESIPPTNQPTGPPVWQLVVRKPYDASGVSEFAFWLSNNVCNYLVGEHPADEKVKTTHCHILIEGLKVTDEALRKSLKRCDISGSDYSMMKKRKPEFDGGPREPYSTQYLGVYIIKGRDDTCRCSSFDRIQIIAWRDSWQTWGKSKQLTSIVEGVASDNIIIPKKKPNTVYQDCDEIIDTIPDWNQRNPTLVERTDVVRAIITWANQKRKALHSVQVMNYYDVIMCNAVPEYYKTLCVDLINRRHK